MTVDRRFAPFRADAPLRGAARGADLGELRPVRARVAGRRAARAPGRRGGDRPGRAHLRPGQPDRPVQDLAGARARPRAGHPLDPRGGRCRARCRLERALRRASPTLGLVRRAVRLLDRQRASIHGFVRDSDRILAAVGTRRASAARPIEHASRVTRRTAQHSDDLAEGVAPLPRLLDATRPALVRLDAIAVTGARCWPTCAGRRRARAPARRSASRSRPRRGLR